MIVRRSMHETYLSNAYLVADREGGCAVIIDTGAPIEPLLTAVDDLDLRVLLIFNTHDHHDHTTYNVDLQERFDVPLRTAEQLHDGQAFEVGDLHIVARSTPGHTTPHFAFVVNGEACFTGDALFDGSVGGTIGGGEHGAAQLRSAVMDIFMQLPPETVLYPGHTTSTTVGKEWAENPFIQLWRGMSDEGSERVKVAGNECTLLLWGPDYDGGHKAWVRFDDGREAIVGGSMVTRGAHA